MSAVISSRQHLASWVAFIRSHSAITRQLNTDLLNGHGLTLSDYEVLLRLSQADERSMRRIDLAESVLLTASGITRLLDGLESAGLVCKENCASDARVTYAAITHDGRRALADAAATHLKALEALFGELYTAEEVTALVDLLGRLPGARKAAPSCPTPPD